MRTRIELDDQLITQVVQLGHFSTRKAAVHAALAAFVRTLKREQLFALRGKAIFPACVQRATPRQLDAGGNMSLDLVTDLSHGRGKKHEP